MQSVNPATGQPIANYPEISSAESHQKIVLADQTFSIWKNTPISERKDKMRKLAHLLRAQKTELAATAVMEMGKPIKQAFAEIEKCAWTAEYYSDNVESMIGRESVTTDATESFISFEPLGVILAVMPWNFPYWQVLRFAIPTVLAGNVGVLKHASNVQGCAQAIERIFLEAGFPVGVFQNLSISSGQVAEIIQQQEVKAVTLTGSEYAGRQVAKVAGESLKKTVLELGGSDPFIILSDANLEEAAQVAADSRLQNCGQSCIAAKRFIVVRAQAEAFVASLQQAFLRKKVGDPTREDTDIGPLVGESARAEIHKQVQTALTQGAELVVGGEALEGDGFYFAPTILRGIKKGMDIYGEEVFGPVALVIEVEDEKEAIQVANDVDFGLGCSLWTQNLEHAKELAPQIVSGCVFVNGMVKSDPRLPFGGVKNSGYGRELSAYGLREFVNVKTVWIR